jgi:predicted DNA-binding transcriptional regulator YafY
MPANKYALLRYRIIDECLTTKGHRYRTLEELRQACELHLYGGDSGRVSKSTIEKDLRAMKEEEDLGFKAPICYSRRYSGYYYTDPDYTIREVSLSEEEKEAIRLAATTLFQFRNLDIFNPFGSAIQKIFNRMSLSAGTDDDTIERFVQFESTPMAEGTQHMPVLLKAIREKEELRFDYLSFLDGRSTERIIRPCLLKEYRNRWYVLGAEPGKNAIKTFGLDRISELHTTGRYFDAVKGFDADALFRHSFGITAGGKVEKVRIRLGTVPGRFAKAQPLHPTQRVVSEDKDGMVIEMKVIIGPELRSTILSYGRQAEVLSPASLKDEVDNMR